MCYSTAGGGGGGGSGGGGGVSPVKAMLQVVNLLWQLIVAFSNCFICLADYINYLIYLLSSSGST